VKRGNALHQHVDLMKALAAQDRGHFDLDLDDVLFTLDW
jgi:hypothetical protein